MASHASPTPGTPAPYLTHPAADPLFPTIRPADPDLLTNSTGICNTPPMLPRSWSRNGRRGSNESLHGEKSFHHSSHSHSHHHTSHHSTSHSASPEVTIPNVNEFLDNRLPTEYFRQDVIRLIHQLRIPGWSGVTVDMAHDLEMNRINGALTNSVYSVKAPRIVKDAIKREYSGRSYHNKLPVNLLLRVYGPSCGLLIDRDRELATVSELTKRNIGPRLLGTFQNGRFEQFLNAKPLTCLDLHNPETSKQIARRMNELHQNVPIMHEDGEGVPVIWTRLEKWIAAAKPQIAKLETKAPGTIRRVTHCDSLQQFERVLQKYREYVTQKYPTVKTTDKHELNRLVFCHNDTQYGNMLRLEPVKGSPLLQPQNEYRQLVVIDFEYSGANPRAIDIVNHFCEWMSDFHHPTMPHHIWLDRYPSEEEQRRFITSYVEQGAEFFDEELMERQVNELLAAAADWRAAVSAFWGIWGIIQTPTETDEEMRVQYLDRNPSYELAKSPEEFIEIEDEESFDCLSYAREKLALFWSDIERLGLK